MNKENKPSEAQEWLDRINRAKKVKENWRDKFRVALAYEYWEGNQRPSHIPVNEWITVNKIFSGMMSELPSLYSQNPEFYVKMRSSYNPDPAQIALYDSRSGIRSAMLNYLKDELDLKPKGRMAIFDAHFQYGVIKVSHHIAWMDNRSGQSTPVMFER